MHCPFVFLFAHFSIRCCNQRRNKFFLPGKAPGHQRCHHPPADDSCLHCPNHFRCKPHRGQQKDCGGSDQSERGVNSDGNAVPRVVNQHTVPQKLLLDAWALGQQTAHKCNLQQQSQWTQGGHFSCQHNGQKKDGQGMEALYMMMWDSKCGLLG